MELSESICRGVPGSRGTWNSDGSKKQLELYSELIKDYDRKNKELIIENNEVKNCLSEIYMELSKSLKDAEYRKESPIAKSFDSNKLQYDDEGLDEDRILVEEIIRQPFDNVFKKFNRELKTKFDRINEKLQKSSPAYLQESSIETLNDNNNNKNGINLSNNMNNLTISSINSYSTKNLGNETGNEDLMNATFTIDDTDNKHDNKKSGYFLEKNMSSSTSSSSASPPSMSLLTEHLEKIHNSNGRTSEKQQIFTKPSSETKAVDKQRFMNETTIQNELNTLKEERKKLAMEKKYFYEQKLKLESESSSFMKISNDLVKQVILLSFFFVVIQKICNLFK